MSITPETTIKDLSQVSFGRGLLGLLLEWLGIFVAIFFSEKLGSWAFTFLILLFIAGRQHGLAFMVHEGVHFLVSRRKNLNDSVVNVLAAWPLFMHLQSYRVNHLTHHQHVNTERDPDWSRKQDGEWVFPMVKKRLFFLFMKSFFGLSSFKTFRAVYGRDAIEKGLIEKKKSSRTTSLLRVGFYGTLIFVLSYFSLWKLYLLYWILPLFTWLQVLNRLRKLAEHFGVYHLSPEVTTRTVIPNLLEKVFIAPKNIHYHNEHHYYPSVPYYHLPDLHDFIMGQEKWRQETHVSHGYIAVLRECIFCSS